MGLGADRPIALVTGANRGLGLETSRQLREQGFRVILTSRREKEGVEAATRLDPEAVDVVHHYLDVTDRRSIAALAQDLPRIAPRLDVLVNNAGIATEGSDVEAARHTIAVNYVGPREVTDALSPFLPRNGGVVMVSSGMGELSYLGRDLRPKFMEPTLTRASLDSLVSSFLQDVQNGTRRKAGWPSAYSVSKVALNALTRILARELSSREIRVNAVCPGWVRTDMGGRGAPRSVQVGGRSIVFAATLSGEVTGGFFRDGKPIPW